MKRNLFILILPLLAASCSIYHPQAVDIPLIEEQGDWRVDAAVGVSTWLLPDAITFGATASYGITPWLSGQIHANYGGTNNFYLQAAPGLYTRLGEHAVLEGYLGVGYGSAGTEPHSSSSSESADATYSYLGHYTIPFAQLNFGWRHLGIFETAFGLKAGYMQPDFESTGNTSGSTMIRRYTEPNILLEPQWQMRLGGEHVKYTLRLSYAWLNHVMNSESSSFIYDFLTISNGLTFCF